MRHLIHFLGFLLGSVTAFGQTKLFERFDFDSTYKIVALCSVHDATQQYRDLTFVISNVKKLNLAKNTITHGEKPAEPIYGEDGLDVYVIKDKRVVKIYRVSPKYGHVSYHPTDSTHGIFKFDVLQLGQVAGSKPINYHTQHYRFESKEAFDKFIFNNKYAKGFLGYEDVTEELSGKFSVVVKKSDKVQTIKEASALVNTELRRIASNKKDYLCGLNLTESTPSTFYFAINANNDIQEKFNLEGSQKSSWTKNLIEISTIWLK